MTTTTSFQEYPDFFDSVIESKTRRVKKQTNPRYKQFNQTHFTAGDEEQFDRYRWVDGVENTRTANTKLLHFEDCLWSKYQNVNVNTVTNTFRYMFHKFKKGLFVKIREGKVRVFLPFSNPNFANDWGDRLDTRHFTDLAKYTSEKEGYRFNPRSVNRNVDQWYANNSLVRYEFPINEGDSNVGNLKNMLEELCENEDIPDVDFFVNRRDFPLLTRDGTEPYNHIWDSYTKPLTSHNYEKYTPILSMVTTDRYADIAIPNHNDWGRVQGSEGKWFEKSVSGFENDEFNTYNWEQKKPVAVFRGASTGTGVTNSTNPRLKISQMSSRRSDKILDAGITSWNLRPRKIMGCSELQTIDIKTVGFGLKPFMSQEEQSGYKYIVHIEGHVAAFRLSVELSLRSVVLMVETQWKVWYSHLLKPYEHFVPIKADLSDLIEQIEWCKNNDDKCKQIAINARCFYEKHLGKKGIFSYLKKILTDISITTSQAPDLAKNPLTETIELESVRNKQYMTKDIWTCGSRKIQYFQSRKRCYGLLKGVEEVVKSMISKDGTLTSSTEPVLLVQNKLSTVEKLCVGGVNIVRKTTNDEQKKKEHVHEVFIGTNTTNKLAKCIPNFSYVFGINDDMEVFTEHIEGPTLFEWITSDKFNFPDFKLILTQLSLALQMAQKQHGFVHWDLTPWNVIVNNPGEVVDIEYKLDSNKVVSIKSKIIPVMIDFGKSKSIVSGKHHGFINPCSVSTSQDIMTCIVTSIKTIISSRLSNNETRQVLDLMNFFSKTTYIPNEIKSVYELKRFISNNGKYNELTTLDKGNLELKTPMMLVSHLRCKIQKPELYVPVMDNGNARQVFEFAFSDTNEKRRKTFTRSICKLKKLRSVVVYDTEDEQLNYENVIDKTIGKMETELKMFHIQ